MLKVTLKDEATPYLRTMLERAKYNKTKLLNHIRATVGDPAQKLYQKRIMQTPFAPSSLKKGRIPGTFDYVSGNLFKSILESRVQGSQLKYGSEVYYAIFQDKILKEKGPITDGQRMGLIAFSKADEAAMLRAAADFIVGDPRLLRSLS